MPIFQLRIFSVAFIMLFFSLGFVHPAIAQVNENELPSFFSQRGYKKHNSSYFFAAKAFIETELKKQPRGSAGYEQYSLLRQYLLKKHPSMQAPPFLDLNKAETGDIGMLSVNNRRITFLKVFQILDKNRSLVKCAHGPYESDGKWSDPILWVANEGEVAVADQVEEGKIFAIGIMVFKKIDDFFYTNQLGGQRKAAALRVVSADNWAAMVLEHQEKPANRNTKPKTREAKDSDDPKEMATVEVDSKYWLRRSDKIRGPFSPESIIQFSKNDGLKVGDEIGTSAAGPWKEINKAVLSQLEK